VPQYHRLLYDKVAYLSELVIVHVAPAYADAVHLYSYVIRTYSFFYFNVPAGNPAGFLQYQRIHFSYFPVILFQFVETPAGERDSPDGFSGFGGRRSLAGDIFGRPDYFVGESVLFTGRNAGAASLALISVYIRLEFFRTGGSTHIYRVEMTPFYAFLTTNTLVFIDHRGKPVWSHKVEPLGFRQRIKVFAAAGAAETVAPVDQSGLFGLSGNIQRFCKCIFFQNTSRLVKVKFSPGPVESGETGHKRVVADAPHNPAAAGSDYPALGFFDFLLKILLGK
jgi:hypothetical protein